MSIEERVRRMTFILENYKEGIYAEKSPLEMYRQGLEDAYEDINEQEEPVSEDLEDAAMSYGKSIVQQACDELRKEYGGEYTPGEDNVLLVAKYFKAGAQWQEKKDQSTIELAEDHAMFAGMEKMKEQIMKDAKSGVGNNDNYIQFDDGTWIDLDPSMKLNPAFDIKEGEKVKVYVFKED